MLPPRPLPAHYPPAVLRMCAHVSHPCAHASAIETRITAPTLSQASAPPRYPAPAVRVCQLRATLPRPDREWGGGWEALGDKTEGERGNTFGKVEDGKISASSSCQVGPAPWREVDL